MMQIDEKILESVNRSGRVGILATVDSAGRPNAAYFGSPRLKPDGTLAMGMMANRSLKNLEQNPYAVFLAIETSPVDFKTPGWRLYLKVREIDREGSVFTSVRDAIAAKAGEATAKKVRAGVVFDVTEVRSLVDMG